MVAGLRLNITLYVLYIACLVLRNRLALYLHTLIGLYSVILCYKFGLLLETNILCTKNSALRVDYVNLTSAFGMPNSLCLHSACSEFVDIQCDSEFYTSSSSSSSSTIGTTAHCGLWPVEKCPYIFSCHQLFPSSDSQHLISFFFLFPSFPGSSPSSRPFQQNLILSTFLWFSW